MIELTEEQAKELLNNMGWTNENEKYAIITRALEKWKEKGWIKKTALEEAEEIAKKCYDQVNIGKFYEITVGEILFMITSYHQAIKELEDKYENKNSC